MNLNEAISILKENHYKVLGKHVMNESEIRFNTADDYLTYRSKLINSSIMFFNSSFRYNYFYFTIYFFRRKPSKR